MRPLPSRTHLRSRTGAVGARRFPAVARRLPAAPAGVLAGALLALLLVAARALGQSTPPGDPMPPGGVPVPEPPRNTERPGISGAEREGETLTASTGSWSGLPPTSYEYRWRRCDAVAGTTCGDIPGAVADSYTLVAADVGSRLRVEVTAIDAAGGRTAAESDPTGVIQPGPVPDVPQATSPADLLAPTLLVRVSRQRLRGVGRRGLGVAVACSEVCDVSSLLLLNARAARRLRLARSPYPLVVGIGSTRVSAGTARVAVSLTTRRVRRALARLPRVRLTLKTLASDLAGNVAADARSVTLRR